ncbi:MAG TPA: type 2 isopentenyl-diphosphate Delta-isomerase, partial [Firmicutes bacterium]|nr:type 2 isopentenyl-diphosphate Delta-isomerase [Bacillota bacterium]
MIKTVTRSKRKLDHLEEVLKRPLNNADFSGVRYVHNSLPEVDLKLVDLKTNLAGINLATPFFINAITGGAAETLDVNKKLALLCKELNMPLAVGSQAAALENPRLRRTYTIVREIYPEGIIFANISPAAGLEGAKAAVQMLAADALQIHLNAPQEIVMEEGERDFRGWRRNIREICSGLEVPVIVKETGFGMSFETG